MLARISCEFECPSGQRAANSRAGGGLGRDFFRLQSIFGALLIFTVLFGGSLRAASDDDDDDDAPPVRAASATTKQEDSDDDAPATLSNKGHSLDGFGSDFQFGAAYGQGVTQARPLLPIEAFPFFMLNNSLYFGDLRFYPTIDGTFGGSVGAGYRYYQKDWDRVFGISGWFDADGTRDVYFQQLGLSLETYGRYVDFRTNLYLPVGSTYQQTGVTYVANSGRYVGDNVVFDQVRSYLAAARGFDMEAGVPIPGNFAEQHGIRVYGGMYYYNDEQGDNILGASARVAANIVSGLDASIQVTNDSYFDTRAFFNVSWTFGPLHRSQLSQESAKGRMGEHVTRNYTVLALSESATDHDVTAIDPETGRPYTIAHVDSAAASGGNGNVNTPFQTIAAAQATNDDIVFVHAGSVFSGSNSTIVMHGGERLLGDGSGEQNFIAVPSVGSIPLPHGPTTGALPVLDSAPGTAVTLANNAELSGFSITNSVGIGILGSGVTGALVRDVQVVHAGTDGIQLVNPAGNTYFDNVTVSNSVGNGLTINGGAGYVQFNGQLSGNQGRDLFVENTASGGLADMTNAVFPGTGSQGILLQNNSGNVVFKNLTETGSTGSGVDIEGGNGQFIFQGTTTVSGSTAPLGAAIAVNNLASPGTATFGSVSIDHRGGEGFEVNNANGAVTVNGTTTVTNELASTASAVSVTNSSANITFGKAINVTNSTGNPGVNFQNNSGTTTIPQLNITSTNGTALYANTAGTLNINSAANANGGIISAVNGAAVDVENTTMAINLFSVSSNGGPFGLKLVTAPGTFTVFGNKAETVGSGGTLQNDGTGILLQNVGTVALASLTLNSNGVGIQSTNTGYLGLVNVGIANSSTYGIDALNTQSISIASSTFSGNGATNIRSQYNQVGSYSLTLALSSLTSSTSDNVLIQSLSGSEGSIINVSAQGNAFQNTSTGTVGLNMNWNGTIAGTISQNTFVVSGGSNEGVRINNSAASDLTTVSYTNNIFTSEGGSDTGFHVITTGPAQLTVSTNEAEFGAINGTGFRFSVGGSSNVTLTSNAVVDTTDGATGILFDSITAPSTVVISNNQIQLAQNGGLLTRGIIFSNVTDVVSGSVTYFVNLSGAQNNIVTGANTPFFAPSGTTTGQIGVNGTPVP